MGGPVNRALKEIDIVKGGKIEFAEFCDLHVRFPFLLYPGFNIQDKMRRHFLGLKWWERKLRKYKEVKNDINTSKLNTDKIIAQEEAKPLERNARRTFSRRGR